MGWNDGLILSGKQKVQEVHFNMLMIITPPIWFRHRKIQDYKRMPAAFGANLMLNVIY
jgi:hypothetical protein